MESTCHFELGAERLLAQDVLTGLDGIDRLLSVCRGDGRDNNRLQALVPQHLVVVAVRLDTKRLEMLLCPCCLLCVWREGCHELGLGCAVQEVEGVAGAHAAQPGAGDLESAQFDHGEREVCDWEKAMERGNCEDREMRC